MAENKKSFVLYADYIGTFEELSDEEAGKLIKHIFKYVNDQNPVAEDKITKISFEPIKQQLKRDLAKWEGIKVKRSEAGKKGMENRWVNTEKSITNDNTAITNDNNVINGITKITVNDTVNVTVTDTVINTFNTMPTADDVGELPEIKIGSVRELIKITKGQDAAAEKIIGMWEIFKVQNLTGKKYYPDVGAVHSHFINWIKTQNFKNGTNNTYRSTKTGRSELASTAIIEPNKKFGPLR